MNECIFHIGMPKTGTSSIQESLYHGLTDGHFRYFGFGEINGSRGITTLFGNPSSYFYHLQKGISEREVESYRRKWFHRLERELSKASASGQRLIISGETAWALNEDQHSNFRKFLGERGFSVKVCAYIRPLKSYLESSFAQKVATGLGEFRIGSANREIFDFRKRIETIERVFGPENVSAHKYDPEMFTEGCVVRDFCRRYGICLKPEDIRRSNDSLSLSAVRLLYTYRKLGPGFGTGLTWLLLDWMLLRRLNELKGTPLRLHSSITEPLIQEFSCQQSWLEEKMKSDFSENSFKHDDKDCIRCEDDLFSYDRASLEWLASTTSSPIPQNPSDVAELIHRLRTRPQIRTATKFILESGQIKARGLRNRFRNGTK